MPDKLPRKITTIGHTADVVRAAAARPLPAREAVQQQLQCLNGPKYSSSDLPGRPQNLGAEPMTRVLTKYVRAVRKGAKIEVVHTELRHKGDGLCAACPSCRRPKGHPLACAMEIDPKLF